MARDITVRFKGDSGDLDADARRAAGALDKFRASSDKAASGASASGGKLGGIGGALGKLGGIAKVAAGNMVANLAGTAASAVTDFAKDSVAAASRLQQAQGGVDAVFGKSAGIVDKYASTSANRLGLSGAAYRELATVAGSQLKNAGQSTDQAAKSTDGLITKASDLAATFGGSTKDAMEAISSLMKGETDPIEKYGVSIKQTDINARLAANGQDKLTGAARKTAEANARLALLTEQTTAATGAFAKENDTLAGKQERASAKMEDAKAKLGQALLPAMTAVTGFMADKLIPGLIAVGDAIGPLVSWLVDKLGPAFTTVLGYVQPVIETIQELWARFGDIILNQVMNVWNLVKGVFQGAFNVISGIFKVFAGLFTGDWSKMWQGIKQIFTGIIGIITSYLSYGLNTIKNIFAAAWRVIGGTVSAGVGAVVRFVSSLPGKVWGFLSGLPAKMARLGQDMMGGLVRAISAGAGALWGQVRGIPGKLWGLLGSFYDKAWHLGADLVRGIGHGISSLLGWLVGKARDMASAPVNAVKSILHIGSPSKVMAELGRDTMRGFTLGMAKEGPAVAAVVADPLAAAGIGLPAVAGRTATASSGVAAAGSVVVNVTVTPLSNPVEVGRQVVDAISAFERMNGTRWRAA